MKFTFFQQQQDFISYTTSKKDSLYHFLTKVVRYLSLLSTLHSSIVSKRIVVPHAAPSLLHLSHSKPILCHTPKKNASILQFYLDCYLNLILKQSFFPFICLRGSLPHFLFLMFSSVRFRLIVWNCAGNQEMWPKDHQILYALISLSSCQ